MNWPGSRAGDSGGVAARVGRGERSGRGAERAAPCRSGRGWLAGGGRAACRSRGSPKIHILRVNGKPPHRDGAILRSATQADGVTRIRRPPPTACGYARPLRCARQVRRSTMRRLGGGGAGMARAGAGGRGADTYGGIRIRRPDEDRARRAGGARPPCASSGPASAPFDPPTLWCARRVRGARGIRGELAGGAWWRAVPKRGGY